METTTDLLDPTAAPVGDPPPTEFGGEKAAHPASRVHEIDAVRLSCDDQGRISGITLRPGWQTEVPPAALGATITVLLAQHQIAVWEARAQHPPPQILAHVSMPLSVACETQAELAELTDELFSRLPSLLDPPRTRITSANRRVTAAIRGGQVQSVEIDAGWAESAETHAIIHAVADAFRRAQWLIERGTIDDPLGWAQQRIDQLQGALDDWKRG